MGDSNSAQPKFAGRKVTLGGVEYTIAPLNVRSLRELQPQLAGLAQMGGLPTLEQWSDVLEIFLAAFRRNHPDMTKELLEELVDIGNVHELTQTVMGISGLVKREGEAQPGTASS